MKKYNLIQQQLIWMKEPERLYRSSQNLNSNGVAVQHVLSYELSEWFKFYLN